MPDFGPGELVRARGREWVTLPSDTEGLLRLRPLSGSEDDIQWIDPELERGGVRPASFDPPKIDPDGAQVFATQDAARLLSDALRFTMRRGAGPFRSAARLGFEPRAYQLVPLMMALRLPVVRLLIADDVGIGKTIEAGLILRELIDRGEVARFTVLCPPHLVDQWVGELELKFDINATAVTAASAPRLERELPPGVSLFDAHPFTVVSLDYIKADRRRDEFARVCPSMVLVDEAHACVGTESGRQQRFGLLQRLAQDAERHLILLTATPHSGDDVAFARLLGLLDPAFGAETLDSDAGRARLARHVVQRRRIDITEPTADGQTWGEDRAFPKHEADEEPYQLTAAHRHFHEAVLDWCLGVVEGAGTDARSRRLAFWGTLALMRCVGSSPQAAISALRNRVAALPDKLEAGVFDLDDDETPAEDLAPDWRVDEGGALSELIEQASNLGPDPKLRALVKLIPHLTNPVIFCRFIATADAVGAALRRAFPKARIEVVTGDLPSDDRRKAVEAMASDDGVQRILVATDCLSEGINLQSLFAAVVHYDLSWNPTRHQQREGRVNRFGQPAEVVRSVTLYSPDSAIDGAVLEVILRKADAIKEATGVAVTLPEDTAAVTGALMQAVLLRKGRVARTQLSLDFGSFDDERAHVERVWRDVEAGEKRSRARFAQRVLSPQDVLPEWRRWRELLGTPADLERFIGRALARLEAPAEALKSGGLRAPLAALPASIRSRLEGRRLDGTTHFAFEEPPPRGATIVHRAHPLTATLAEALLEAALDPLSTTIAPLGRAGAWVSAAVERLTVVALARLRFKLIVRSGQRETLLLAEEAATLAWVQGDTTPSLTGLAAAALLEDPAAAALADLARARVLGSALETLDREATRAGLAAYATGRAEALAADHARLRAAARMSGEVRVEAVLPLDLIGVFALLPKVA
ncbi:DEAD/DEAH box helicase [Phenylobacterium sp.]|uniref:DEAD/DEAH box helicase n=1 Tax=Phenylobacterium sp. TaxID=1871053 RepID=UPI0025EC2746|nr:DEAD/DEAH box helicase [Phenylobacterium sp.]